MMKCQRSVYQLLGREMMVGATALATGNTLRRLCGDYRSQVVYGEEYQRSCNIKKDLFKLIKERLNVSQKRYKETLKLSCD